MNFKQLCCTAAVFLCLSAAGLALDLWSPWGTKSGCQHHCVGKFCCDDYHPKPLPCAHGVKCFTCDHYVPKCLPLVKPVKQFCCDDYCPKPLPKILCPPTKNLVCPLPPVK